jgi:hypothetical protein
MTTKESIMSERLGAAKKAQDLMDVYLTNGVKLVGKVDNFDDNSIQLTSNIEGGVTIERRNVSAVQKHPDKKGDTDRRS